MERIAYKIALDVTKAESQKFLTGFSVGESRARVLKITLNNGRNPVHFDGSETISMFVTKPSDSSPSIGLCYLEGDTIVYNVLQSDVSEEGPTKFSIKVEQVEDGLITVLYAAHFTIQVTDPECDDSHVPDDPNYSILEALIAEVEQFDSDAEAFAIGTRGGVPVGPDDPAYENNAKFYAENLEYEVEEQVERAEAWASGTKGGVPVPDTDPSYQNNSKFYKEQAATSATNAATSESNASGSASSASGSASSASASSLKAEGYAVGTQNGTPAESGEPYYHDNSKFYKEQAATSATNAATSESNASGSASAASGSASSASASSLEAEGYAKGTQGGTPVASGSPYFEANAKFYKEQAATSATNAATSESNASGSASSASASSLVAEGWAKGTQGGVPVGPGSPYHENNAEYFKNQAASIVGPKVTSFNGRENIVVPQKGDYNSAKIEIDPSTTSLPNTLDTLQDYLEYMYPPGVSVTLTLNGAKNDVITIKDSNDETVGTCTFTSGQTSGTVSITVHNGGGSYKFISSVAKSLVDGTSDYEKTVTLSDAVSQTVNVYPKNALYWFGNFVDCTTFSRSSTNVITRNTSDSRLTVNTNNVTCVTDNVQMNGIGLLSNHKIDGNGKTLKVLMSQTQLTDCGTHGDQIPNDTSWSSDNHPMSIINTAITKSWQSASLGNYTDYVAVRLYSGGNNLSGCTAVYDAVYIDDGHENDITIHGAKEDTITITDSNNQTVATCVFGTNHAYGYVSKSLLPSGTYTFTSTVGSYSKTVTLDGSETEVNVYPDNYLLWHGNNIGNFELYANSNYGTSSFTENVTNLAVSFNGDGSASMITGQKIDLTDVNTITVVGTFSNFLNYCIGIMPTKASPARQYISADFTTKTSYNAPTVLDVSNVTGEYYFCVVGEDNRHTSSHFEITSVELT